MPKKHNNINQTDAYYNQRRPQNNLYFILKDYLDQKAGAPSPYPEIQKVFQGINLAKEIGYQEAVLFPETKTQSEYIMLRLRTKSHRYEEIPVTWEGDLYTLTFLEHHITLFRNKLSWDPLSISHYTAIFKYQKPEQQDLEAKWHIHFDQNNAIVRAPFTVYSQNSTKPLHDYIFLPDKHQVVTNLLKDDTKKHLRKIAFYYYLPYIKQLNIALSNLQSSLHTRLEEAIEKALDETAIDTNSRLDSDQHKAKTQAIKYLLNKKSSYQANHHKDNNQYYSQYYNHIFSLYQQLNPREDTAKPTDATTNHPPIPNRTEQEAITNSTIEEIRVAKNQTQSKSQQKKSTNKKKKKSNAGIQRLLALYLQIQETKYQLSQALKNWLHKKEIDEIRKKQAKNLLDLCQIIIDTLRKLTERLLHNGNEIPYADLAVQKEIECVLYNVLIDYTLKGRFELIRNSLTDQQHEAYILRLFPELINALIDMQDSDLFEFLSAQHPDASINYLNNNNVSNILSHWWMNYKKNFSSMLEMTLGILIKHVDSLLIQKSSQEDSLPLMVYLLMVPNLAQVIVNIIIDDVYYDTCIIAIMHHLDQFSDIGECYQIHLRTVINLCIKLKKILNGEPVHDGDTLISLIPNASIRNEYMRLFDIKARTQVTPFVQQSSQRTSPVINKLRATFRRRNLPPDQKPSSNLTGEETLYKDLFQHELLNAYHKQIGYNQDTQLTKYYKQWVHEKITLTVKANTKDYPLTQEDITTSDKKIQEIDTAAYVYHLIFIRSIWQGWIPKVTPQPVGPVATSEETTIVSPQMDSQKEPSTSLALH